MGKIRTKCRIEGCKNLGRNLGKRGFAMLCQGCRKKFSKEKQEVEKQPIENTNV